VVTNSVTPRLRQGYGGLAEALRAEVAGSNMADATEGACREAAARRGPGAAPLNNSNRDLVWLATPRGKMTHVSAFTTITKDPLPQMTTPHGNYAVSGDDERAHAARLRRLSGLA
jgi:predicted dinucleotide-binding enzyme